MENQFPQKRGDVDHAASSGQMAHHSRPQVDGAHRDRARHDDAVRSLRRDPDCASRGYDPCSLAGASGHHSVTRVDKLVFGMKMFRDHVTLRELVNQGCNRRRKSGAGMDALSYLRH